MAIHLIIAAKKYFIRIVLQNRYVLELFRVFHAIELYIDAFQLKRDFLSL